MVLESKHTLSNMMKKKNFKIVKHRNLIAGIGVIGMAVLPILSTTADDLSPHDNDSKSKKQKPNIIFILADDLGYGDVGFNGQDKIKTPNIDRIAAEGIVFKNHYAGSTVSGPSRACLMTGKHTGHCTVRGNPRWTLSGNPVDISDSDITVAEELKRAGYTTGVLGKWGLAEKLDEGMPHKQGFDFFLGFCRHTTAHHYYPENLWRNDKLEKQEGTITQEKKGKYSHDTFTSEALNFIETNKEKPFFLYLAYTIPHYELTVPEDSKEQYKDKNWALRKMKPAHYLHDENGHVTYAAMVSRMDRDIGRILKLLKTQGLDENTIVIFTSDNGHEYDNTKNEFFNSNGVFRGRKRDLYEGGIHVPFAARWVGHIKAGTSSDHLSAFWDFLPTACDIAGIKTKTNTDGISYLHALTGKKQKKHDYLYWEFNEKKGPIQAVRKDKWKAVKFLNKDLELYNLSNDPAEKTNLAAKYPDKVKEMTEIIAGARTEHPEFPLTKRDKL